MKFDLITKVKLLDENMSLPFKKDYNDAGYDLSVSRLEDCGNYIKVYTGISIEPELGFYFMMVPRSSIYKKGLFLANSCAIIDNGYRGEIIGIFYKSNSYKLPEIGERVLQLIPQRQIQVEFVEANELSDTNRGEGGFGSTGK